MNFFTNILHLIGSGATAYIMASNLRDPLTRPNTLAGFQLTESGAVPFLTNLGARAAEEGDAWLAEKLAIHAADEQRHGQIFAHGIKQLGKQVMTREEIATKSESEQQAKPSPFLATYYEGYDSAALKAEQIDWIVFMASTYILELDASRDFRLMAQVLPDNEPTSRNLKQSILSVAKDETRHAAYLYEALQRRLSSNEVERVVEEWRKRKVDAMLAVVSNMVQTGGKSRSLVKDGAPTEIDEKIPTLVEV